MKGLKQKMPDSMIRATEDSLPNNRSKKLYAAFYKDKGRLDAYWYRHHLITLEYDDYPLNPRAYYSNVSKIVVAGMKDYDDINEIGAEISSAGDVGGDIVVSGMTPFMSYPLYCHESSGAITISTNAAMPCPVRCCGVAIVTKDSIMEICGTDTITKKEVAKAEEQVDEEMRILSAYLSGLVYNATVYDMDGEVVESIGDCYDQQGALDYAKTIIDNKSPEEVNDGENDSY